jgi:hypothetical protein
VRLDLAFLVERELFAQEQNFGSQGSLGTGHQRNEGQRFAEQIPAYIKESEERQTRHALGASHVRSENARRILGPACGNYGHPVTD